MDEFLGLRGGNRLAGGSLRTVAAILVRLQVERKGGDKVVTVFFFFFYAEHFSWAARGTPACRRISTHDYGDFSSYTTGTGE